MKALVMVEKNHYISFGLDTLSVKNIVDDVYEYLTYAFLSDQPVINIILSRLFSRRGKGIRATFMTMIAENAGCSWDSVFKAAVVIEAIHLASLLHDDVVDLSDVRRGEATLNAVHSNKVSILFGDYIFTKALITAQEIGSEEAVSIIHNTVESMVAGEILDSLSMDGVNEEMYFEIIKRKTASLFAASGELGAILSSVDGLKRRWAKEMGESLGMAFQIIDDTLDFQGDAGLIGKPVLKDDVFGSMTLPLIHSLKGMSHSEIRTFLAAHDGSPKRLADFVHSKGGVDYAFEKARFFSEKAQQAAYRLGGAKLQSVFGNFCAMLMSRPQ